MPTFEFCLCATICNSIEVGSHTLLVLEPLNVFSTAKTLENVCASTRFGQESDSEKEN